MMEFIFGVISDVWKKEGAVLADIQETVEKMKSFLLTTGYNFEGHSIQKYHGPICAEAIIGAVVGTAAVPAGTALSFSDALGKQADGMDSGRYAAMSRLLEKAKELGANGIIGIAYQYVVVDKNSLLVMISGTAVTV